MQGFSIKALLFLERKLFIVSDKFVLVDFDGTLLNYIKALHDRVNVDMGIDVDILNSTSYTPKNFSKEHQKIIKDVIYTDVDLYRNLQFFDGARESLEELMKHIETRAYTGSCHDKEIYKIRLNLIRELGMRELPFTDKKPYVADAFALIDDCDGVHKQFIENGFTGLLYLIDAPYNREQTPEFESRIIRVGSFTEAARDLLAKL